MSRSTSLALAVVALLAGFAGTGCQATVGNYFKNRARDLGESFRVQVGGGLGIGASVSLAGVADVGLAVAAVPRDAGIGWVYGEGYAFGAGQGAGKWESEVDLTLLAPIAFPIMMLPGSTSDSGAAEAIPLHWRVEGSGDGTLSADHASHACFALVPAFFAGVGNPDEPLDDAYPQDPELDPPPFTAHPTAWSEKGKKKNPKARIHAFDLEARIYAGIIYAKFGFSPGQFADFLLGVFGLDIAGDDTAAEKPKLPEP